MTNQTQLRQQFDAAFSRPGTDVAATDDFLAISLRGHSYAVRLPEVAGLHSNLVVAPLKSRAPALLGICGLRGVLVPVFDLGLLLGHGAAPTAPRWLALARARTVVAFAFDALDSHLRVARGSTSAVTTPGRHVAGALISAPEAPPRSIISFASLIEAVTLVGEHHVR